MAQPNFNRAAKAITSANKDFSFGLSKVVGLNILREFPIGIGDALTDETELTSYLGTPVYDTLTLGYINEKGRNNYIDEFGNTLSYDPIRLVEVILDVNITKNIVSTVVAGNDGMIHQYMGIGDYVINVNGRISGQYNPNNDEFRDTRSIFQFQQSILKLISVCKLGISLPVSSRFLNNFGIKNVVITNASFPQMAGVRNYQEFSINMLSDNEQRLTFTEEEINNDDTLSNILQE